MTLFTAFGIENFKVPIDVHRVDPIVIKRWRKSGRYGGGSPSPTNSRCGAMDWTDFDRVAGVSSEWGHYLTSTVISAAGVAGLSTMPSDTVPARVSELRSQKEPQTFSSIGE